MRKALRVAALAMIPLLLSGCWSYRSLTDIAIVMGVSVDRDSPDGGFTVGSEIADLTKSIKQTPPSPKLVAAKGSTIFEAVRDAKRKLNNKLYFGNTQVAVIGERTARESGIMDAVDWIVRDSEPRETVNMLIAQGCDGMDLLKTEGLDQALVSLEIDAIITDDSKVTSSTVHTELYQAYDVLAGHGESLTLPAFRISDNDGKKVVEVSGTAAFKGDRLVGFLAPEENKFFLIATGRCRGGILALAMHGKGVPDTSLEIGRSTAKTSFSNDGRLAFRIETQTDVYLAETMENIDVTDPDQIDSLQREAGKRLELEIGALIRRVQTELKTDIFGFGLFLYQHDPALWRQLENQWDSIFETLPVSVSCKVNILNTAYIRTKEVVRE